MAYTPVMALDLTRDVPRSPFDDLDGYVWLPRMIDKARAFFAGTQGEYSPYPCPGDTRFLGYFKLDAQALGEQIRSGATDEELVAYVRAHTPRSTADKLRFAAEQVVPHYNLLIKLALWGMKRKLRAKFVARYPNQPFSTIDSFAKMLAIDEGHPIPGL